MISSYAGDSLLNIDTEVKKDKTVLKKVYFTAPYKITKPFYDYENNIMKLCIMNVSPGMLEGDSYIAKFNVGEGSKLHVYSQSYSKIFGMKKGCAFQNLNIRLAAKSRFEYYVEPTMPFQDSKFKGITEIHMDSGSTLIYREIISCGRYKKDEVFKFKKYSSLTKIFYEGKLIFLDNTVLEPEKQNLMDIGFYEGFTHQANIFIVTNSVNEDLRMKVVGYLKDKENISFGASIIYNNVLVIRMLGKSSEELCKISEEIREWSLTL